MATLGCVAQKAASKAQLLNTSTQMKARRLLAVQWKKENQIFLIYKEIQKGSVAKSYMTNGLLIYG
jgi:hypothetical protein